MVLYNYQQWSIIMNKQQILDFAKESQIYNIAELPKGFKFYCVQGTKKWYSHGDLNQDDRLFLIVAPNENAALTWARFEYLAMSDTSIESYKELMNYIKENTVDSDHDQYPQFEDYIDVGDYQFRSIDSVKKIPKSEALIINKHEAFNYCNFYMK